MISASVITSARRHNVANRKVASIAEMPLDQKNHTPAIPSFATRPLMAMGVSMEKLVAAMEVPHFLDYVDDGCLIITPGDRSDIILASLLAAESGGYPRVAGLLLTGGMAPAPQLLRLLEGRDTSKVPVFKVQDDTFTASLAVSQVRPTLLPGDERKIAAALGLADTHIDANELRERLSLRHSRRITPLMFEYELVRRARSQRRHIVLPEGLDERILRAAEILSLRDVDSPEDLDESGRAGL